MYNLTPNQRLPFIGDHFRKEIPPSDNVSPLLFLRPQIPTIIHHNIINPPKIILFNVEPLVEDEADPQLCAPPAILNRNLITCAL